MTIDLLPTIAHLVGADPPKNKIDGLDVWPVLSGEPGKQKNPHESYWEYYENNQLQAVTTGRASGSCNCAHVSHAQRPARREGRHPTKYEQAKLEKGELYDLKNDRGEKIDVSVGASEIVKQLEDVAEKARAELGDTLTKREGTGNRKPGLTVRERIRR